MPCKQSDFLCSLAIKYKSTDINANKSLMGQEFPNNKSRIKSTVGNLNKGLINVYWPRCCLFYLMN